MSLIYKKIRPESQTDLTLLSIFLKNAGSSIKTFRYFNSRDFKVLENHSLTFLAMDNGNPVAYAHLDNSEKKVWLGIAVSEGQLNKGIGKQLLIEVLKFSDEFLKTEIQLSVDKDNLPALKLYGNIGFNVTQDLSKDVYLMLRTFPAFK